MKHIKLIAIISILASMTACTDWLSIEPEGKIVAGDYWKLESDVEAVVATCYRSMIEDDIISRMIIYGELRSDNLIGGYGISENMKKIIEANIQPTNPYANWSSFYKVINYCNIVIHYAPTVIDPNFSQSELNAKLAEVIALRAMSYFYLVRAFGEVPFVTSASITDIQDYNIPKSSEDEILDYLETDLIKAEAWAMTAYGKLNANKGRITKNAIRALLADIYLWRNKYDECIAASDRVLADPLLKMIDPDEEPYLKIFGLKNSTESIFELQFSANNYTYNYVIQDFYGNNENPAGRLVAPEIVTVDNEIFTNTPEVTDVRRKDYITPMSNNKVYHIFKYAGSQRTENLNGTESSYYYRVPQSQPANWIIYRLTDVMLMKAEALVQKERLGEALKIVNTTFLRSNPTITDTLAIDEFNDKEKMEKLVLVERQRELMFEGKRWFDLMRMARRDGKTNRLVETITRKLTENQSLVSSKMKVMDALYFPIHESEIDANPNLKQNPFYESKFK
ncbi:MAG: RagB/SusD family nutrient uptake outer membrane protein [Paludibacteraceae bacterium]|nr:RagB/SusD family nutrient uptake outer membrane protein [Paludibacteraceae bacterium]